MEYTLLGRTGLRVSRLALGTAVLGLTPPDTESDQLIHAALDAGINFFDCANTYGNRASFDRPGMPTAAERKHAEELLGRGLKGHRDEVVLCTKVSEPVGPGVNDGGMMHPMIPGSHGGGLSRFHIMREVERSLRRLNTDHIDVYHMHHPDPETPIDETMRAMDDLVHSGKVRYIGLSTYSGWQSTQAVMTAERDGLTRPVLNQVAYNLINRLSESEIVPAAIALGLSITCFSPLAGGALAGAAVMDREFSGVKRWGVPFKYTPEQEKASRDLDALATKWGNKPAHLALRWLLSRKPVAAAIIGPETPDELRENAKLFDVQLDDAQMEELDQVGKAVPGSEF